MSSAIISGRENREEASTSESLKTVHDTLVSTQNEIDFIIFEEGLHSIRAELHNISSTVWISHKVWLDAQFTVAVCWVTPENIHNELLLDGGYFMDDFKRPSDLFNLLQTDECASNSSVEADNSVLNYRS